MKTNFWKLTTVGLIGYMIGRDDLITPIVWRLSPYHSKRVSKHPEYKPISYRSVSTPNKSNCSENDATTIMDSIDGIYFANKEEAWTFLDILTDYLKKYKSISAYDFMKTANMSPDDEDEELYKHYGWYDLFGAQPIMTYQGVWILDMPELEYSENDMSCLTDPED